MIACQAFLKTGKLVKNADVLQLGTGKNLAIGLYSETTKAENLFVRKKTRKTIKKAHAFKNYAQNYNFEFLNSCNPELQLKNTESVNKNKLINSLSELRGF